MKEKTSQILSVNFSDSFGGAARAAYRIHSALNQHGGNGKMLVKDKKLNDDTIISVMQFDRTNILKNIWRFVKNKVKNKLQHYTWGKYSYKEDVFLSDLRSESIHGAFQKIDYDILHLHWINLRFLDLKELRKVQKPIVWTLHDCWPFTGVCHNFHECDKYINECGNCPYLHSGDENDLSHKIWKQKKQLYKGLNLHIVTPSHWLADVAQKSNLFSQFPVSVIPNSIDTKLFYPEEKLKACKSMGFDPEMEYILFGAMNAIKDNNKGFNKLIEALKYYTDNYNYENIVLLVFGANEPGFELELEIPVNYLGVIKDDKKMVEAYCMASVVVVPSFSENLSNTIMESLSCGTPVTAFNIGGNGDMIDHQQNGYLAKAYEPEDLANGIKWCLDNNVGNHLSTNARQKVEENFCEEIIVKKYFDLYNSLIVK